MLRSVLIEFLWRTIILYPALGRLSPPSVTEGYTMQIGIGQISRLIRQTSNQSLPCPYCSFWPVSPRDSVRFIDSEYSIIRHEPIVSKQKVKFQSEAAPEWWSCRFCDFSDGERSLNFTSRAVFLLHFGAASFPGFSRPVFLHGHRVASIIAFIKYVCFSLRFFRSMIPFSSLSQKNAGMPRFFASFTTV